MELVVNNPTPAKDTNADLTIEDYGSVCIIRAETEDGEAWIEDNLRAEPWQFTLGGVALDFRLTELIVDNAIMDGMVVGAPAEWQLPHPWRTS